MLADNARRNPCRQVGLDWFPRFAVVRGYKNVRVVIVGAMAIESEIGSTFCVAGRNNATDVSAPGNTRHVTSNVFPGLTTIARNLQIAIIGSGVQQTFLDRRLSERHNLSKRFHSVVTRERVLVR